MRAARTPRTASRRSAAPALGYALALLRGPAWLWPAVLLLGLAAAPALQPPAGKGPVIAVAAVTAVADDDGPSVPAAEPPQLMVQRPRPHTFATRPCSGTEILRRDRAEPARSRAPPAV